MRVTQGITNRQYVKQTNYMLESMLKNQTRLISQKQYTRASENSQKANKALTIRRQLRELDMYDGNLSSVKATFSSAETSLYTIANNIYLNVQNKLETACNGSYNQTDLDIFAGELEEYAGLTVESLNADYAGRQLFGGENNSVTPFTTEKVNDKYVVSYNGVEVDSGTQLSDFPGSNPVYVDIGIGIKYDSNYNVDPQTAIDVSLNGAEITGYGCDKDANGNKTYSNNFVQMIYDAASALREGNIETANATLDRLDKAHTGLLNQITKLGIKQNSMDFYIEKNDEYRYSLSQSQNDTEGCDMNKEITQWKTTDAAYQAALQISSNILPKSIFDFI